jgi:tetratricopeptide (TPR) repeat protein
MRKAWLRVRFGQRLAGAIIVATIGLSGCARWVSPAKHLSKGKEFLQQKNYQRAVVELLTASQGDPKNPEPYYQLALAYLAMGQTENGIRSAMKATVVAPKYAPAQAKVAELMTRYSNDPQVLKDAVARATAALAVSPENTDAKNALAMAELGLGDREKSVKTLEEVLVTAPGDLKTAINLAKAKLADHNPDGAIETLKNAAASAPKSVDHALALGQLYMQLHRPAEAEAEFRRVLIIDSKRTLPLALIAQMQMDRGQLDLAEASYRQLSALGDKEYKHAHANFQFQHGKREEAIREFEQLWKSDPEDRAARSRLVSAYTIAGRPADADRLLKEALHKNPKDEEALSQQAVRLLAVGKAQEAGAALTQLLHSSPNSAEAHYLLAQTFKASGSLARQRQELAEAVGLDSRYLQARLDLSRSLLAVRNPDDSLKLLDEAPADQKKLVAWMEARNWALLLKGNAQDARRAIDGGLSLERNRNFLFQDASLKLQLHQTAAARTSLEEILRTRPDDAEVLQSLAVSYTLENRPRNAVDCLRRAAASRPKSVAVNLLLANWLEQGGDLAGARMSVEAARTADPGSERAALALAELDLRERKLDSARQILTSPLNSHDDNVSIDAQLLAGGVEDLAGNYKGAIGHYHNVLAKDPGHVAAMQHLAYLLADKAEQPDEALTWAQKAAELAPNDPQIEDTLGWTLYHKGMYRAALKELQFASAPASRPRHKLHLALVYFKLGDRDQGSRFLAAASHQNPDLFKSLSASEAGAISSR